MTSEDNPTVGVLIHDGQNLLQGFEIKKKFTPQNKVAFVRIVLYSDNGTRMRKYRDIMVKLRDDIDLVELDTVVSEDLQ